MPSLMAEARHCLPEIAGGMAADRMGTLLPWLAARAAAVVRTATRNPWRHRKEAARMRQQRILPENTEPFAVCREEAAALWGVGCTKFDELVADGTIPRPLRIGARTLWDLAALRRAWKRFADENGAPDVSCPW